MQQAPHSIFANPERPQNWSLHLLAFLLLPNIYIAAVAHFVVPFPPPPFFNLEYLAVGCAALYLPWSMGAALLFTAISIDLMAVISRGFGMAPRELVYLLKLLRFRHSGMHDYGSLLLLLVFTGSC